MKLYRYIFYKIYMVLSGFTDSPGFWSNILMYWLFLTNTTTIIFFLLPDNFIKDKVTHTAFVGFFVLIMAGHFLYFNSRKVYQIEEQEFKNESKIISRCGYLLTLLYVGLTIWVFSYRTVPYIEEKNQHTTTTIFHWVLPPNSNFISFC